MTTAREPLIPKRTIIIVVIVGALLIFGSLSKKDKPAEIINYPQRVDVTGDCAVAMGGSARYGEANQEGVWTKVREGRYIAPYKMQNAFGAEVNGLALCIHDGTKVIQVEFSPK